MVQRVKDGENIDDVVRAIITSRENIAFVNYSHSAVIKKILNQYNRNAIGFLAWLQKKAKTLGNTFEVRWCRQQSFVGKKPTQDEIITWVTELINIEQAEWVDDDKNFRLLND